MSLKQGITVNAPSVIGEVLGGEAIIVNLDSGAYYSLDGVGAEIWIAAQSGATLAGMIDLVVAKFSGASAEIAAGVTALVEELVAEGLFVVCSASPPAAAETSAVVAASPADRPPFVQPILQKYTDMADLLLLDPIHEVGEQGWPQPAPHA